MTAGTATTWRIPGPMSDFGIRIGGGQGFTRAQVTAVVNNVTLMWFANPVAITADGQHLVVNHAAANGYLVGIQQTLKWFGVMPNVANLAFSTGTLAVGTWKHVVMVRDAGTWKYYLNGTIDTANAGVGAPIAPSGAVTGIHNNTSSFDCRYAHVSIHETALSASTIAAIYAAGIPQTPADEGGSRLRVLGLA
jgi:hypothetical protein